MNSLADLAGKLHVYVEWHEDVITRVDLRSSRPHKISRLLQGKPLSQALAMVPMIFSLCGVAQQVAALRAAESALGLQVRPEVAKARQILVWAETARELGLRLAQGWLKEQTLVCAELLQWFTQLKADLRWALELNAQVDANGFDCDMAARRLATILKPLVGSETELSQLLFGAASTTPVGQQIKQLQRTLGDVELALGAVPLSSNTPSDLRWITEKLSGEQAFEFCAQPDAEGTCYETSIWTRNCEAKLVEQGQRAGLNELTLRFLALVDELQVLPGLIRDGGSALDTPHIESGLGCVEAARGLLIHRIELEGDSMSDYRVADYKIVAPTEWNFHPQGTLVQMLDGARVSRERLLALVEKLILLVDPCVDWEIEIGN